MKLLAILLLSLILISSTVLSHDLYAKSKESKIKDKIIKSIGASVEGKYSTIKLIQLSKSNVSGYVIVYNTTQKTTPVPPAPIPPTPEPTGATTKVCLVGDLKGSIVPNLMSKGGCNYKIGLGDLGYSSDLSYFKGLKFDKCVIGNHDSLEDGSSAIYKEALSYCGDHWSLKIGNGAMVIGLNTNGDVTSQVQAVQKIISQSSGIKTIILVSHKNGHVFPNAHHPAEAKSLYSQLESIIPTGVKLYEISGHNHDSAAAPTKNWYIAGMGGKSSYACGKDADWTFCDNTKLAYLELTISNTNGATAAKFIN